MNDDPLSPDALDALDRRSRRGEARGADSVLAAARATEPSLDLTVPAHAGRRVATVAAAAVVLLGLAAGGIALARRTDHRGVAATGPSDDPLCVALARRVDDRPPYDADVTVYLQPGATRAQRDAERAVIDADPRVARATYVDQEETYRRFRALFADSAAMLDNVRPRDLPPAFELTLVDVDDAEQVATDLEGGRGVYEVRSATIANARTLDLLVWPGHDESVRLDSGDSLHGLRPYPKDWPERVAAVRAAGDLEVRVAVKQLTAELRQPSDETRDRRIIGFANVGAQMLEDVAADRCGLTPARTFTRPVPVTDAEPNTDETTTTTHD